MKKYLLSKGFLLLGLTLVILGVIIHISCPTELESTHFYLDSDELFVRQIKLERSIFHLISPYQLQLRVTFSPSFNGTSLTRANATVVLLDESEYTKFVDKTLNLEELIPITVLKERSSPSELAVKFEGSNQYEELESVKIYLLVAREQPNPLYGHYYLGITPLTYYMGIIYAAGGILLVVISLMWISTDWKRYLTLGVSVNVFVFIFRLFTLGKYNSLNLSESYLGELLTFEMYNDLEFWYMSWIEPFLNGVFPYGSLYTPVSSEVYHYQMPPLFIITLGLFALIPLLPLWKIALPMFLSHITTGILVFFLSRDILGYHENTATKGMLFYYLNPISLVYASFCLFNPSLFTFFTVLGFFLVLMDKKTFSLSNITVTSYDLSFISLAIGTMYKQFAAIFFPILIIILVRQQKNIATKEIIKTITRYLVIYGIIIFIIILPAVCVDFLKFLESTIFSTASFGIWWTKNVNFSQPVTFNSFFVVLGFPNIITDIIGFLIVYWIFLGGLSILIYTLLWIKTCRLNIENTSFKKSLIFWILILSIIVHLFYPRGSFKYYLILLIPFLSIHITTMLNIKLNKDTTEKFRPSEKNKWYYSLDVLGNLILLLIIVSINRYIYFMILFLWFWFLYFCKKQRNFSC
ncbi:MAG: hypothetical protein ACXACK_09075 [Candidatus Hodarchaeales archaeon]